MTFVPDASRADLLKLTGGTEPLIIDTNIPWAAHHDGTCILGHGWNGHVFIRVNCHRNPETYHLGDATGLTSPVFLKSFNRKSLPVEPVTVHTSQLIDVLMRRFQSQLIEKEIPDVMTTDKEYLCRALMKYLASSFNCLDKWIQMDQYRCQSLIESYSIENIKLVYPMIRSIETWDEDIKQAYIDNTILPCTVPDVEIFNWVEDILNNF